MSKHSGTSSQSHSTANEQAMHDMDRHASANGSGDAIPASENGSHERSVAAHLGGTVHDHTKKAGDLRKSIDAVEPRQPPQEVSRIGKDHRRQ